MPDEISQDINSKQKRKKGFGQIMQQYNQENNFSKREDQEMDLEPNLGNNMMNNPQFLTDKQQKGIQYQKIQKMIKSHVWSQRS